MEMEEAKWGPLLGRLSFINISCGKQELNDAGDSRKNTVEVAMVVRLVQTIHRAWKRCGNPLRIAVASHYSVQVAEIQEKLARKYDSFDGFFVNATQIEELTGEEYDIVLLSTVRSRTSDLALVELPCDQTKCDVAAIRARHCLWILGDEEALAKCEFWNSYIDELKTRKCFFNIELDRELHEFAVQVRREIDQLDAMLESDGLVFENTRWKVLLSDSFKKSLEKIESKGMRNLVINMLLRLANGWRPKKRDISISCDLSKHVLKKFQVKRLHLICSIDIMKESSSMLQVLRVWDLLPLHDIPGLVKHLDNMFMTYTRDFLDQCNTRYVEGDLEIPYRWETWDDDVKRHKGLVQIKDGIAKKLTVSDNFLLMKFYSVSSCLVNHMLSGCNGTELELPFELTGKEMEIVHFEKTSFVLGRSGTGKTTVLIRKLFQREQLYHLASEGFHELDCCTYKDDISRVGVEHGDMVLRQIFITLNPRLCYVVKDQISGMKRFVYGGKTSKERISADLDNIEEMLSFRAIPDSFVELPPKLYPLAITLDKFLLMLDGTLGNSFFERFSPQLQNTRDSNSIALRTFIRMKEVTFQKFDLSYWPRFDKALTKSLKASSVFTEIMSHIKGGLHGERLSLSDYLSLSQRRVSNYNTEERKAIYDIFLLYEKKKSSNGEYDLADLVIDLHGRLKRRGYEGDRFDYVYVDEVQDLTMSQMALLRYLCSNVESGFFFSGDTAQTIAKGVEYRFEDTRRLFYEEFLMKSGGGGNYAKGQKGLVTDLFQLSTNFRTHAGVLKLAQSITDLIYHFFPLSIDVLIPETSLVAGKMPVLIESDSQNALITMFSNGVDNGKVLVGFGAEQVILVRDDNVRNGILKYVGKCALILTIAECKGLEFQDVLLYNFFSTSPLEYQWRVIYQYMKEKNIVDGESPRSYPRFDKRKHSLLCSELKQLYVAITRTKQRLWILENLDDFCNPMFDYWKLQKTVEVRQLDSIFVDDIKVTSSNRQWTLRGIELLNQKKYESAKVCFKRANEQRLKRLAKAGGLRASAWHVSCSDSEMAYKKLIKAAELYSSIDKFEESAECFYEAKEYALAGDIYVEKFGNSKLKEAGECFSQAGLYCRAAHAFSRGKFFPSCIDACIVGKLFDEGLNFIKQWENYDYSHDEAHQIKATEQKVLESAAFHHWKLGNKVTMMKYVRSFDSIESVRKLLKTIDSPDELLEIEEEWGNFERAAFVAEKMGKTMLRVYLLEKAKSYAEASSTILSHAYASSLWCHGSYGWPLKKTAGRGKLLERAIALAKKDSCEFHNLISLEVEILFTENISVQRLHQGLCDSKRRKILRGQIVCARKILDAHFASGESAYICSDVLVTKPKMCARSSLSVNQVTISTLLYIWDVWKKNIERIFNYLERLNSKDSKDDYGNFCLNHLGVTETRNFVSDKTVYLLLDSDAYWAKQIDKKYLQRRGDSVICKAKQFVHAARRYWSSEMISVGSKVCDKLRDICKLWKHKSLPRHCQVIPVIHMFHVAKSLVNSTFLLRSYNDQTFHRYLDESCDSFSRVFFPLDWTELATLQMIKMRETEKFREFIRDIGMVRHTTFEKLENAVMMVIACGGRLNDETYEKFHERFHEDQARKRHSGDYWSVASENPDISRVLKFHRALLDIYYADSLGRSEYVSPSGFIYLVERVTIATLSLKGRFCFTRSCFVEWLADQDGENPLPRSNSDWEPRIVSSVDTVAAIVFELLSNRNDVAVWIRDSKLAGQFVVRLLMVLCLLRINTGKYYDLLYELVAREDVSSELPPALPKMGDDSVGELAEALAAMNNPLVIASQSPMECHVPHAIFVDLNAKREQILAMLIDGTTPISR